MKVITLCGSLKFKDEMMIVAQKFALSGNCVLTPIYPVGNIDIAANQLKKMKEAHLKRIELSDAILVINKNGYIGKSTLVEIDYAKKLGKEILYYADLME